MFTEAYLDIIRYMEMGGDVLWYIAGLVCFMWTLIFERIWYFQAEHKKLLFDVDFRHIVRIRQHQMKY